MVENMSVDDAIISYLASQVANEALIEAGYNAGNTSIIDSSESLKMLNSNPNNNTANAVN